MAWTRRQVVTILSALYLFALTIIASYCMHAVRNHSLPISTPLGAFTVALPAITGLSIESVLGLNRHRNRKSHALTLGTSTSSQPTSGLTVIVWILTVFDTVLATLAGTHVAPANGLNCGLNDRWRSLYSSHDASHIKRIQDAFNCCGLNSIYDMAWPFPDKEHPRSVCSTRYDRSSSCNEPWRNEERRVAGLMLLVVTLVFGWKMLIVLAPIRARRNESSWFSGGRDTMANETPGESSRGRRAIDYEHASERYSDDPVVEERDVEEAVPAGNVNDEHEMAPSGVGEERVEWSR